MKGTSLRLVKIKNSETISDHEDDSLDVARAVLINIAVSEKELKRKLKDSKVISNHYVEEASKASTIGKQILVDQEPEELCQPEPIQINKFLNFSDRILNPKLFHLDDEGGFNLIKTSSNSSWAAPTSVTVPQPDNYQSNKPRVYS